MIIRLVRRLRRDDRGVAMPVVVGLGLVMLLLVATAMSSVTDGVRKTNTDEDIAGATAAAYAGVEEYQSRLANDATYYKFGNPAAPFSASSAALLSLPTGANDNPAFNTKASQPWARLSGSDDAWYRYEVDISKYASQGIIRLLSTGRVGDTVESVVADLKQKGFIDFLWFTDFEETDPAFNSTYAKRVPQPSDVHLGESPSRPSGCSSRIQFGAVDVLKGPVHSNDTLDICGATFQGTVTTSDPTAHVDVDKGCAQPKLPPGIKVQFEKELDMPPTNSQMKKETRGDLPADVPNPGCLYTGPTRITFTGNGKMNVVSPYTLHTETTATGYVSPEPEAKCGKLSDLHSTAGATIPVLDLNLVYVQTVPTVSTDPNYWASNKTPAGVTCQSVNDNSVSSNKRHSDGISFGTFQFPIAGEYLPATSTTDTPAYSCRNGDLYVSGSVSGRTTLAADNYVYVTGDLTYANPLNDLLGLVGQNAVWIWNPITKTTTTDRRGNTTTSYAYAQSGDREIDAAILSVAHTLQAQNYDANGTGLGARGTLTIIGAIAQKYRGTVATGSGSSVATGFAKNYQYDDRLRYTAPPKFLTPVSTTYGVTQYAGVPAAFGPDGSTR
jgi:hypothetical protein